jgi:integrase
LIVQRAKSGRNPGIVIHPALRDFLDHWRRWTEAHRPGHPYYFPGAKPDTAHRLDQLGRDMQDAAQALGLPKRTSHGLRAYYVSARRSQGADDLTIAAELGQRSGAALVASTYGDPQNIQGDHRLDWLPEDGAAPAWKLLETIADNVIQFGT